MIKLLEFLDSIEGHGYGGMADFEIARSEAREGSRIYHPRKTGCEPMTTTTQSGDDEGMITVVMTMHPFGGSPARQVARIDMINQGGSAEASFYSVTIDEAAHTADRVPARRTTIIVENHPHEDGAVMLLARALARVLRDRE